MRLYRVIGPTELLQILQNNVVYGRFTEATKDNEYKAEYGPVVCCFTRPVHPSVFDSFIVQLAVDESQVKGQGLGRWHRTIYDKDVTVQEPEVYISHYTPSQVEGIYPLNEETVLDEFLKYHWNMDEPIEDLVFLKQVGVLTEEESILLDVYLLLSAGHPKLRRKDELKVELL